jgi:hypothetical protein
LALAERARGTGHVDRIFINLERRTPPRAFHVYGPRLVPAFDYLQTAVVLAVDGYVAPADLTQVAQALIERAGFTPRRLANTLADVVRRGLVAPEAALQVAKPLQTAGLLPTGVAVRSGWLRRLVWRLRGGRHAAPVRALRAIDYDAILDRRAEAPSTPSVEANA